MATINAAAVYQSLMAAAITAPTEREAGVANSQRFEAARYLRSTPHGLELEHHQAHDVTYASGATWTDADIAATHRATICSMAAAAYSELMTGINDPEKVTVQTGERSRVKLVNTRERLQAFAEHVRKHQALYGGGIARTAKPRAAVTWPAASVRLVAELVQDGDYRAAVELASEKCGAGFYHMKAGTFMTWAPQPVEGMPDGFITARRSIDGKWVCMHQAAGYSTAAATSRAAAARDGLAAWEFAGEAKRAAALAKCAATPHDQAAARAAFMAQHDISETSTEAAPLVAIVSELTGATIATVSQTVADLVASATAAAAIDQASEATQDAQHQAPELATVDCEAADVATTCEDASSARHGATLQHGSTSSTSRTDASTSTSTSTSTSSAPVQAPADPAPWVSQDENTGKDGTYSGPCRRVTKNQARAIFAAGGNVGATTTTYTDEVLLTFPASSYYSTFDYFVKCVEGCTRFNERVYFWAAAIGHESTPAPEADPVADRWNNASEAQRAAMLTQARPLMDPRAAANVALYRVEQYGPGAQLEIRAAVEAFEPATDATPWHRSASARTLVKGKSGQWSAWLYRNDAGAYVLQFEGLTDGISWHQCATAGERVRMLQALAKQADAQPAAVGTPADATNPAGYAPAAPDAGQQTAPVPSAADKVPQDLDNHAGTTDAPPAAGAGRLQITITRAEGHADECGRPVTVDSFAAADALLRTWSESAPKTGGYDKCDFSITWPDGGTYGGRYDLKHHTAERPSLTRHMIDLAEFYTGANCPAHMAPASYARHMETIDPDTRAAYADVLATLAALGAYFPRARPVAADLVQALADGIAPAELVGLGVVYAGNTANDSGTGAIVATEPCNYYTLRLTVQLEDGRELTANANQFDGSGRARFRLDQRMHGAPYLAQLAGAVASKNASESAQKTIAAAEHARQLQTLAAEFPQLQRPSDNNSGPKLAAVNMRILLKAAFKGVKFSVTSERSSARVHWTDGPTVEQVTAIIGRFDIGASDTQSDYFYTVKTPFSQLFGGAQYLTINREDSPELIARALADLYPCEATRPSVADWQNARGAFDWRSEGEHARRAFRQHLASLTGWSGKA